MRFRDTRRLVAGGFLLTFALASALCVAGCRHKGSMSIAEMYRARAEAEIETGDTVEAAKMLSRAERLEPKSADTQVLIGEVFRREGHPDEAEARYKLALKLRPDFPEAHNNLGVIQAGRRNWDGAILEFRLAAEDKKYRERELAYNNLGRACLEKKDLAEAEKAFRQAVVVNPRFADSRVNLGRVLFAKGDLEGAAAAFRNAIRLEPRAPEPYYRLALVSIRLGQREQAIDELRAVMRVDPSGSLSRDALRLLSMLE